MSESIKSVYQNIVGLTKPFLRNEKGFLQVSILMFGVNIFAAFCNYAIIFFIARLGNRELLSQWTALNSLILVLISPIMGLRMYYSKRLAVLSKERMSFAFDFLNFFNTIVQKVSFYGFIALIPTIYLLKNYVFQEYSYLILSITLGLSIFQFTLSFHNIFLLGVSSTIKYCIAFVTGNFLRLTSVILMIFSGFDVISLPISLFIQLVVIYLISDIYMRKIEKVSRSESEEKTDFSLKGETIGISKSMIGYLTMAAVLQFGSIISDNSLSAYERDVFAVIFNIGNIIHFGSTSFLSAFIVQAAQKDDKKILTKAITLLMGITGVTTLIFIIFNNIILMLLDRTQYSEFNNILFNYFVFIGGYNLIFIFIQYIIAKNKYRFLYEILPVALLIFPILLVLIAEGIIGVENKLGAFVFIQSLFGWVISLYLFSRIYFLNREEKLPLSEQSEISLQ